MSSFVSIIIPCYNQGEFLSDAIQSALNQDYPYKEIIVVNDGSTDNTRQVAHAFGNTICYIEQPNKGVSGSRNAGICAAKGEYVAFLDSDDQYLHDALSTALNYLHSHPDIAMVCGDAVLLENKKILGLKSSMLRNPRNHDNFRWETVEFCPIPSTVVLRHSCFAKAGLFDENLIGGAEDWLMWIQMSLHFNMSYLNKPFIYYRLHDSNATRNKERIDNANRQAIKVVLNTSYFKEYPPHFRARLLIYRFATGWRVEPKVVALRYLLKGLRTDPMQISYFLRVIRRGIPNSFKRVGSHLFPGS